MLFRQSFIFLAAIVLLIIAVVIQSQADSVEETAVSDRTIRTASAKPQVLDANSISQKVIEQALPELDAELQIPNGALSDLLSKMDQRLQDDQQDYEAQLIKGLVLFQSGHPAKALTEMQDLAQRAPTFHLAHLVRGDMLAAQARQLTDIGDAGLFEKNTETIEQLNNLRHEVKMRINANLLSIKNKVPLQILTLAPSIRNAIVVDKSTHRLYLFERKDNNSPARLIRDYYISTGRATGNKVIEGDLKTPEGVYFITSYIPDNELPEKYGIGAFPTNYPNALDKKLGKTGDGIWLHGTDRIYYSRPPLDSEGCVVLSNLDLNKIRHLIRPGQTPMIIANKIDWVNEQQWNETRNDVLKSIEKWRADWESLDVERYLDHYSNEFWSGRHNLQSWRAHKSRIASQKTYQKVALSDLSLFYYPEEQDKKQPMVVAKFRQQYQSNNFQSETGKKLYLGKQSGNWRILYEGR